MNNITCISLPYQKFFAKFNDISTLEVSKWDKVHCLGYICKRYKDYYGFDFTFSFSNSAPSKCRESWQISTLTQQLSSDPIILKHYIDYVFDTKVILRKKKITSLGFFINTDIVNEYKFKYLFNKNDRPERATPLPTRYIEVCKEYDIDAATYGDVSFISKMSGKEELLAKLEAAGLNLKILDEIK